MNSGNKVWSLVAATSVVVACGVLYYHYSHPKTVIVEKEKIVTKEIIPDLAFEVYLPKDRQKLTLQKNEPVKFIWSGWDKKASYQLTVQNEFNEVANIDIKTNEVELRIEKGSHFRWSLKSTSPLYGIKSARGEFFVEKVETKEVDSLVVEDEVEVDVEEKLQQRKPASETVVKEKNEAVTFNVSSKNIKLNYPESSIKLSWKGNPYGTYRFLITRLSDKKVVVEDFVQGLSRPIFFTNPGEYKISLHDPNKSSAKELDSLSITYGKKVAAFDSVQPIDITGSSLQINYAIYEGESVRLRAFHKESKAEIGNFKVKGKSHRFVLKQPGEYCFELVNVDSPRNLSSSGPVCAKMGGEIQRKIASTSTEAKIIPLGKIILNYYKINGSDTYQFDLPEVAGATTYQVRLFSDSQALKLLKEVTLQGRRVFWKTQREQKTYIQYRALNKSQELTPWSEIGELIFPISPLEIN